MTTGGAFVRLLLPSVAFFIGLPFLSQRRFESALVGAAVCSFALPWLVITIIRVVRLLRVEPPAARQGFDVIPVEPTSARAAG
jgi:hypothetical protein